jgi:hypothetical protein
MKQVFEILPPPGSSFTIVLVPIALLLGGLLALFVYTAYAARTSTVELTGEAVRIRAPMYGRSIPLRDVQVDGVEVLDLNEHPERGLSWRTNGMGLPGYKAGWFNTKSGEKVLAFVTDRRSVVYIPTRNNYGVLLSMADPKGFAAALKGSR